MYIMIVIFLGELLFVFSLDKLEGLGLLFLFILMEKENLFLIPLSRFIELWTSIKQKHEFKASQISFVKLPDSCEYFNTWINESK